jgi:hypothetical protein
MRRLAAVALAASAMTAVSVALAAPSANADLVTYCIGEGGAVTVPGDLFVPPGESCSLDGTTVTGNVRVAAGANLVVKGGSFKKEVQIAADGYFDATNTTVDSQVVLASGGFGIFLKDTTTGNLTVQPKGSATSEGFLFIDHATINGNLSSSVGDARVDNGSQITGNVSTTGTFYTDLRDSFVDGTLSVTNGAAGSVVCGTAVQGMSTFTGNQGGVQLGPNGSLASCTSGGYFGRDVNISNTTGAVRVDDNIVNGKLILSANNPMATVAANNRIRGGISGDHQAPSAMSALAAPNRPDLQQRVQDRRAKALQSASAAESGN